ncbi:aspartate carbamoyltransferase regulatory subunit [Clostridium fallax]|uniref:Aspartate carbamoyltransferase regulatory subunit n=1 Tax=Clostridium fallax TaxID=1533 RepID=A0A1M4WV94_9CLOT|nr:aspartate carbamoyltransferase regulatory subunit [Clostridium fallax]SHE84882.1 aspartate carbamoyltransferase regulatory subunit [Clostridium fallax]SQB07413.1 aspartate carbamoyltransferase [Clostridium fallax]
MIKITKLKDGIVIDHIKAGRGYEVFKYLKLQEAKYPVTLIMNVESKTLGKKDIIKIGKIIDMDLEILGLISPEVTLNILNNENVVEKVTLELPEKVEGIIECNNPRCITTVENYVPKIFKLTNKEKGTYRCIYCDNEYKVIK